MPDDTRIYVHDNLKFSLLVTNSLQFEVAVFQSRRETYRRVTVVHGWSIKPITYICSAFRICPSGDGFAIFKL
jgi:hypothetical protein